MRDEIFTETTAGAPLLDLKGSACVWGSVLPCVCAVCLHIMSVEL